MIGTGGGARSVRRAATSPRALLAGLALVLGFLAMASMHAPVEPSAGPRPTAAAVPVVAHLGHSAAATSSPLLTDTCATCGEDHEGAVAACALMLAVAALLMLAAPRRFDPLVLRARPAPRAPRGTPWRPSAPDLHSLGISRT